MPGLQHLNGWRPLFGADADEAYGNPDGNWYYPKAFAAPNGKIFILGNWVYSFWLDTTGNGSEQALEP